MASEALTLAEYAVLSLQERAPIPSHVHMGLPPSLACFKHDGLVTRIERTRCGTLWLLGLPGSWPESASRQAARRVLEEKSEQGPALRYPAAARNRVSLPFVPLPGPRLLIIQKIVCTGQPSKGINARPFLVREGGSWKKTNRGETSHVYEDGGVKISREQNLMGLYSRASIRTSAAQNETSSQT
jgi:hypothetical protein